MYMCETYNMASLRFDVVSSEWLVVGIRPIDLDNAVGPHAGTSHLARKTRPAPSVTVFTDQASGIGLGVSQPTD